MDGFDTSIFPGEGHFVANGEPLFAALLADPGSVAYLVGTPASNTSPDGRVRRGAPDDHDPDLGRHIDR